LRTVHSTRRRGERGIGTAVFTITALVIIGLGVYLYLRWADTHKPGTLALSPEAKTYVRSLKLGGVEMKAHESYLKQMVVEIDGNIGNEGDRLLETVELNCVFYDSYGQLVLRERVPIVSAKMGGLKPGETKRFRLPFDSIPESWNRQMPQLVIAGIRF
jgi:hypothetical protein